MRHILQPGRPAPERIQWAEARGRAFSCQLEAGLPLLEAARRGFAAHGFAGGVLNIKGGSLGPLAYVMPALSKTKEHAAFYSDIFRPPGITRLRMGAMTLGQRDGAPFFHCHGLWTEADGRAGGGHILPEETIVAEPFEVDAFGLDGALFTAEPDPETNFKLFGPIPSAATAASTTSRAYALRLRPNQDFAGSLEVFCREQGIVRAKLHGGVGSIIGARFADDVALVDYLGGLTVGRLVRGDNPVLMTMELVLEVLGEGA
ncbi:MAG: DNA-binding protein [Alphaproteobacteria bacterium]|nr:MAG: DNA-binding protein [Alphaproteobacteria bacterium]